MNRNSCFLVVTAMVITTLFFCKPEVVQETCIISSGSLTTSVEVDSVQPIHVSMSSLAGSISISEDSTDTVIEKSFKLYLTLPNQKEKAIDIVASTDTGDRGYGWGSYTPEKVESLYELMFEPDTLLPDKKRGRLDTLVRISDSLNVNHYRVICNKKGGIEAVFFKNESGCQIVWSWKDIIESIQKKPSVDTVPSS